jgi:hypothetical protein
MSVARHHADWLSLLEISGPFVSMPVLMRVFPQGLDPRDPEQARQLRLAYEEWQSNPAGPGKHRAWINQVLTGLLSFPTDLIAEGQSLPPGLSASMAEYGETLRPDMALVGPKGTDAAGKPQLLVSLYPLDQLLERPVSGKHWKASPGTRMMELLHASDVPVGLVTNGEQWMLVFAPRGETTGFTSWYANLWIDESVTLRAFHSLLSINRFFGVAATDTLSALLMDSSQDQQEVTNQLGDQVRDAVEVLIQAFDRLDHESGRILLKGVEEKTLYDAALTVMMRLVFLFSAEERGLLHLGRPIYDNNYAVSTLREQLQEVADRYGEEVLERRFDAWARLLSSFRAVHGGVQHQDLLLPSYGGSLFDPNRYPFLEGRAQQTDWHVTAAEPLAINNRVVLHLLKSLQMLQVRVAGGGPAEARRISFRALDIEQIGHIYEGLLDHSAFRAKGTVLGLVGTRKNPTPDIALDELERLAEQGQVKLLEELEELTDRGIPALKKFLAISASEENHKILVACGQDEELAKRVKRFAGLVREDSFERPVVVLEGGIYVSEGTTRRSTGTHYTPRSLTEPIVQHALEPLVYRGPAEGLPRVQWALKSPQEILDLKVCDMTMGSGAFLVQVCRFLSERLTEAWENLEKTHAGELLITPEGSFSKAEPSERLIPKDPDERVAIARRFIADRCLYGVDINPMAVEMAKLSIWLITLDKTRPFTFLDHAFKCGDSVLGISRLKQLEKFSLDDSRETQAVILSNYDELIRNATAKRRELETLPSNDTSQIVAKAALNSEAEELVSRLKLASDLLITAALTEGKERQRETARVSAHLQVVEYIPKPLEEFRRLVRERLNGRRPFHWPLEFPEVFERMGFDAFVGNPPFMVAFKVAQSLGTDFAAYIKSQWRHQRGRADLSAYFLLRVSGLLRLSGSIGLITTKTISQEDNRRVALDHLLESGFQIYRALPNRAWPGVAAVHVCVLHMWRGAWVGDHYVEDKLVAGISSALDAELEEVEPFELNILPVQPSKGTTVNGTGFILTKEEAESLLLEDPENRRVIRRYLNGAELNDSADGLGPRFIIDFAEMSMNEAQEFPGPWRVVESRVAPSREAVRLQVHEKAFWKFSDKRPELYQALSSISRAIVFSLVSKYFAFAFAPADQLFSSSLGVIPSDDAALFGTLQSSIHLLWAQAHQYSLKGDPRYSIGRCYRTFPFPDFSSNRLTPMRQVAERLYKSRHDVMLSRELGLRAFYDALHDPQEKVVEFDRQRALQAELDKAVASVYGWTDLDLGHGFYSTPKGVRYTLSEAGRRAVLKRLLSLNHQSYEEEGRLGHHQEMVTPHSRKGSQRKKRSRFSGTQDALFVAEDSE